MDAEIARNAIKKDAAVDIVYWDLAINARQSLHRSYLQLTL